MSNTTYKGKLFTDTSVYSGIESDNLFSGNNRFDKRIELSTGLYIGKDINGDLIVSLSSDLSTIDGKIKANKFIGDLEGNADSVTNGVYTTGDQTIEGEKTFLNGGRFKTQDIPLGTGLNEYIQLCQYSSAEKLPAIRVCSENSLNGLWFDSMVVNSDNNGYSRGAWVFRAFKDISGSISKLTSGNIFQIRNLNDFLFNIDYAGIISTPKQSSVEAVLATANMNIPRTQYTPVIFNSEIKDEQDEYDTSTGWFTCKTAGEYIIHVNLRWEANSSGVRQVRIEKGTSGGTPSWQAPWFKTEYSISEYDFRVNIGGKITLTAGERIRVSVYQDSGVDLDLVFTTSYTRLSINKVK